MTDPVPPEGLTGDNPLWQFAIERWREPAVEQACLACQSEGWSVTHLLVAAWAAQQGLRWDGQEPSGLRQWREAVTESLRQMRRVVPKNNDLVGQLRRRIKDAELASEQVELAWWHRHLSPLPGQAESRWDADHLTIANLNALMISQGRAVDASLKHLALTLCPALRSDQVQVLLEQPAAPRAAGEGAQQ